MNTPTRLTLLTALATLNVAHAAAQSPATAPAPTPATLADGIPDGTWRYEFTHFQDEVTPDTWAESLARIQDRATGLNPEALREWVGAIERGIELGEGQAASRATLQGAVTVAGDGFYWETVERGGWGTGADGAGSYRVLGDDERCYVRSLFHGFEEEFYVDHTPPGLQAQLHFVGLWSELLGWRAALEEHGEVDPTRALVTYVGPLGDLEGVKAPPWFAITVDRVVLRVVEAPGRPRTETVTLLDPGGGVVMQYASEWRDGEPRVLSRKTYLPYMTTVYDALEFRVLERGEARLPALEALATTPVRAERVIDRTRMKLSLPVDLLLAGDDAIDAEIDARLVRREPAPASISQADELEADAHATCDHEERTPPAAVAEVSGHFDGQRRAPAAPAEPRGTGKGALALAGVVGLLIGRVGRRRRVEVSRAA